MYKHSTRVILSGPFSAGRVYAPNGDNWRAVCSDGNVPADDAVSLIGSDKVIWMVEST